MKARDPYQEFIDAQKKGTKKIETPVVKTKKSGWHTVPIYDLRFRNAMADALDGAWVYDIRSMTYKNTTTGETISREAFENGD